MEPVSSAAAERSIWAILVDVFFAPAKAFESYKLKPNLWVPLVLTILLGGLAAGITVKQSSMVQYDLMKNSTTLPAPVLEQMRVDAQNPNPIASAIGGGVAVPIISLILALLAMLMGNFMFGGKAKYLHIWGAMLTAGLIGLTGGLLRSFLIVAKDSLYVSLGPAALMPGSDFTSVMYSILYFGDLFAIWGIIVAAFAYKSIFDISMTKGATISILLWVLAVIFFVGTQQIGFAFMGVETTFF